MTTLKAKKRSSISRSRPSICRQGDGGGCWLIKRGISPNNFSTPEKFCVAQFAQTLKVLEGALGRTIRTCFFYKQAEPFFIFFEVKRVDDTRLGDSYARIHRTLLMKLPLFEFEHEFG